MNRIAPIVCVVVAAAAAPCLGQQIWSGYDVAFEKPNFADWTLEENQDRITDSVWITRKDTAGLFNIAQESAYTTGSPADTAWALGSTDQIGSLVFEDWVDAVMMCPPCEVDVPMVVHLISEDIYIDVRVTSWTGSVFGGGFAYERGAAPKGGCNGADLAAPLGTLDFSDVLEFLTLFAKGGEDADLAEPVGVYDFSDVLAFLTLFGGGCP